MTTKLDVYTSAEVRREGMAHVRAQMLAAHKRQLPNHRGIVAEQLRDMIRTIENTQARNGE